MKNKKLIILFIFFLFSSISQIVSQDIYVKITYKKKRATILKKANNKNDLAYKMLSESKEGMNKLEYSLIFDNKSSLFNEVSKMDIDNKNTIANTLSRLFGGTQGVFFTNRIVGKTIHQKEYQADLFLIEHDKIEDWVLTQEKRKIGNYVCYKATKKDSYINSSGEKKTYTITAWYTPKLPYPYGPTTYNGLPGVILELTNRQTVIFASKIELNPKEREEIIRPKKGIDITKEEYDKMVTGLATDYRKKYRKN